MSYENYYEKQGLLKSHTNILGKKAKKLHVTISELGTGYHRRKFVIASFQRIGTSKNKVSILKTHLRAIGYSDYEIHEGLKQARKMTKIGFKF